MALLLHVDPRPAFAWNLRQKSVLARHGQRLSRQPATVENLLERIIERNRNAPEVARSLLPSFVPALSAPGSTSSSPYRPRPAMVAVPDDDVEDDSDGEDDEPPLATMHGEFQVGSTLGVHVPDDLLPSGENVPTGRLEYCWCRCLKHHVCAELARPAAATTTKQCHQCACRPLCLCSDMRVLMLAPCL